MKPKFYVYAGYYENYISTEPLEKPRVLRKFFYNLNKAINYAESFEDSIIFCTNTRKYLQEQDPYLVEQLDERHEWFNIKTGQLC